MEPKSTSQAEKSVLKRRLAVFAALLIASWVTMSLTHELGHLAGGWIGGATLIDYTLVPWRLPYSLHTADPSPLLTLWAGPLLGVAVPVLLAFVVRRPWGWFIADFCLLANGSYLALAWISGEPQLDTPRLLDAGAHPATIAIYCLVAITVGYARFRSDCRRVLYPSQSPHDEVEKEAEKYAQAKPRGTP